jgi:hypothetical protein
MEKTKNSETKEIPYQYTQQSTNDVTCKLLSNNYQIINNHFKNPTNGDEWKPDDKYDVYKNIKQNQTEAIKHLIQSGSTFSSYKNRNEISMPLLNTNILIQLPYEDIICDPYIIIDNHITKDDIDNVFIMVVSSGKNKDSYFQEKIIMSNDPKDFILKKTNEGTYIGSKLTSEFIPTLCFPYYTMYFGVEFKEKKLNYLNGSQVTCILIQNEKRVLLAKCPNEKPKDILNNLDDNWHLKYMFNN